MHFPQSAAPGTADAMAATFANAATPYYSYMTYCCGIPYFCVAGGKDEWLLLQSLCMDLSNIVSRFPIIFHQYLDRVAHLVGDITAYAFADMSDPSKLA